MIDTGAAPNLMKKRNISINNQINSRDILFLKGIMSGNIPTLGSINANYMGHPIKLYVVDNDFPISQEGILGSTFLRDAGSIDFKNQILTWQGISIPLSNNSSVTISARTRGVLPFKIINSNSTEGYVPRPSIRNDVFVGDAVVSNYNGIAYIGVINSGEAECKIPIPTVELEEIEIMASSPKSSPRSEPEGPSATDKKIYCVNTPTLGPGMFTQKRNLFLSNSHESVRLGNSGNGSENYNPNPGTSDSTTVRLLEQRDSRCKKLREPLRLDVLNEMETDYVEKILTKYGDLFRLPNEKLECTSAIEHRVVTTDDLTRSY